MIRQCGKLNLWGTHPKTYVLYMFYTKFHSLWSIFYSPSPKCTRIGEQASISFPHCKALKKPLLTYILYSWYKITMRYWKKLHLFTFTKSIGNGHLQTERRSFTNRKKWLSWYLPSADVWLGLNVLTPWCWDGNILWELGQYSAFLISCGCLHQRTQRRNPIIIIIIIIFIYIAP